MTTPTPTEWKYVTDYLPTKGKPISVWLNDRAEDGVELVQLLPDQGYAIFKRKVNTQPCATTLHSNSDTPIKVLLSCIFRHLRRRS